MGLHRIWDVTTSTAASAARPNFGNVFLQRSVLPEKPLESRAFERFTRSGPLAVLPGN